VYKLYNITNRVNRELYKGIKKLDLNQKWIKYLKDSQPLKYLLHRAIKNTVLTIFYQSSQRNRQEKNNQHNSIQKISLGNKFIWGNNTRQRILVSVKINHKGRRFIGKCACCLCS
jgi:predicted ribonuclease YlaK